MGFESVRGYVQLASGLTEVTRARATEAAQGLLSLPASGIHTGSKVAGQAGALAEELFAAATTNRSNLTALVRSEVDIAVTRLGLVSAEKLEEARAEVARLRAEVARLRSASSRADISHSTANKAAAPKRAAKRVAKATSASSAATTTNAAARPTVVTKTPKTARTATRATTARRPAVTTRAKPAAT